MCLGHEFRPHLCLTVAVGLLGPSNEDGSGEVDHSRLTSERLEISGLVTISHMASVRSPVCSQTNCQDTKSKRSSGLKLYVRPFHGICFGLPSGGRKTPALWMLFRVVCARSKRGVYLSNFNSVQRCFEMREIGIVDDAKGRVECLDNPPERLFQLRIWLV